ncbi:hypothetical protein HMPREF1578_01268 [Gardnerella pickettii JCP8017B]|nr:hypothetical protein HMPREF1578_01268 [Gardnerella pickettii JCP8017B]
MCVVLCSLNFYLFIIIAKCLRLCFKRYCANEESVSNIQIFVGILEEIIYESYLGL